MIFLNEVFKDLNYNKISFKYNIKKMKNSFKKY